MAIKSKGRGTAATVGLLLLLAGLVGGGVLFAMSLRRPAQAVDGFARAPVGCATTLEFSEVGTFFVYEELPDEVEVPEGDCVPTADPATTFDFTLTGPGGAVSAIADESIAYDLDRAVGVSVARIEIAESGQYEIDVRGDDEEMVAAIGRDPDDGVEDLRRGALAVGAIGIVLGGLLLLLAGRRSRRAATYDTPTGPGWGPTDRPPGAEWPPRAPQVSVPPIPISPQEPGPAATPSPPPLPARSPAAADARLSPWAPPATDDEAVEHAPPEPSPPLPDPVPPDRPGRSSRTSSDLPPPEPPPG